MVENKKYTKGRIVKGIVSGVTKYGIFIKIDDNYSGLIHISEISDTFIKHPSDVLKVGQVVKVRVISVDVKKNRIGLTMRNQPKK